MAELDTAALGARAEAMIKALGAISAEPARLVRLFLTPEHRRAADLVGKWMREAGLEVSELRTRRRPLQEVFLELTGGRSGGADSLRPPAGNRKRRTRRTPDQVG